MHRHNKAYQNYSIPSPYDIDEIFKVIGLKAQGYRPLLFKNAIFRPTGRRFTDKDHLLSMCTTRYCCVCVYVGSVSYIS